MVIDFFLNSNYPSLPAAHFAEHLNEFQNPACHLLYSSLCELIGLDVFCGEAQASHGMCAAIFDMFFVSRFTSNSPYPIDANQLVYWINAAGLIISNLPESYWYDVFYTK